MPHMGGNLQLGSWQVPERGLPRPMFSHPLLSHRPSQRFLVPLSVMCVVARWQMCLHPSQLLRGKEECRHPPGSWKRIQPGLGRSLSHSTVFLAGPEPGAQKPPKVRAVPYLLHAIVSSGVGGGDRKAAEVNWPLRLT